MIKVSTYTQPSRFMTLAAQFMPWIAGFTLCAFGIGLYLALVSSPPDYQQGETVRIMYVHVPCAWMAIGVYIFIASLSAVFIIWNRAMQLTPPPTVYSG
jgi:ABC-type transport system involved in cytochrome c biogenesis, permease component